MANIVFVTVKVFTGWTPPPILLLTLSYSNASLLRHLFSFSWLLILDFDVIIFSTSLLLGPNHLRTVSIACCLLGHDV